MMGACTQGMWLVNPRYGNLVGHCDRTRCDGLQKTLKALDLAPYVTGPDVVEAVAKMKVYPE